MNDLQKLIRKIRDHVAGNAPSAVVETLAAEYVRACADAAARLDTCAAMLSKGSEYQALQLAETEPPLLDLLAALSFADARQWTEDCANRGLPTASPFDPRAVSALDELYRRGVSPNHPLYRDYRSAVTARDDARALGIIRTIERLNPGDENAKSELNRLENKAFQALKSRLHAALERGDDAGAISILDELERIPAARDLPGTGDYERAAALRRAALARAAGARATESVAGLAGLQAMGDWRNAAAVIGSIASLEMEHGFSLSGERELEIENTRAWVDRERAAEEVATRFANAVSRLRALSTDNGARLRAREPISAHDSAEMLLGLERAWKEVESFGRPVGDEILNAARSTADAVRAERHRLQRARVVRISAISVAAIVAVAALGWWGLRARSAAEFGQQLAKFEADGEVEPAERLAASLLSEKPGLAAQPALQAQLEKAGSWTRECRRQQSETDGLLAGLESETSAEFASVEAAAFSSQLDFAASQIAALPASLRPALQSRLDSVRTAFEGWVAVQRQEIAEQAETELARFETAVKEKLRLDAAAESLAAAMEELEPAIRAFEARANPSLKALELPAALATRFTAVSERANLIRKELDILARCREGLLNAQTLDDYRAALEGFKVSQIAASPEVQAAGKLGAQFPTSDALLASLLIPDDPVAWQAVQQDAADPWHPKNVVEAELNGFFALRDDPLLNSIHEATLVSSSGNRKQIYVQGNPGDAREDADAAGRFRSWKGKFYNPKTLAAGVDFSDMTYTMRTLPSGKVGDELTDVRETAVMLAFKGLELERMTDAEGEKYEVPILRQLERVATLTKTPPAFRAYLMVKLATIADYRPNSWGLHYCASLRADLAELRALTADSPLRSSDWLSSASNSALASLMDRCATRKYFAEAQATRAIVAAAMKAGLKLGGYVDATGTPNLLGEARAGFALWTLDSNAKIIALDGDSGQPLAPVLFVPARTADLISRVPKGLNAESLGALIAKIPLVAPKP